jgi:ligand-binding sensor domain-containing protein
MNRRAILVWLLAAAILPSCAFAEHTRYWTQTDFTDFQKGSPEGIALRSDGKLNPAPRFAQFSDPNLAFLWALRSDSHGRLYAAGGSDAKVFRFDDAGKTTPVFESSELAAQAIAFDSHDNLYVATSPDGKVYKVTPDGTKSVFFEPHRKYIWALGFDAAGNLFVATGDRGEVFVVGADAKGQLFYQSHERHARSLAFDAKGNLLIGTEPDGLILRVEIARKNSPALPAAGASFVIYETSKAEVTSLVQDAGGNLYAAAVGEKTRTSEAPRLSLPNSSSTQGNTGQGPGGIVITTIPGSQQQSSAALGFASASTARGAEIVRIAPDGSPEILWTSDTDLVYAPPGPSSNSMATASTRASRKPPPPRLPASPPARTAGFFSPPAIPEKFSFSAPTMPPMEPSPPMCSTPRSSRIGAASPGTAQMPAARAKSSSTFARETPRIQKTTGAPGPALTALPPASR